MDNNLYNDLNIVGLDPIKDKQEIFDKSDLSWAYVVRPLFYYDNNKNLVPTTNKQLLIDRDGSLTEVAVRGKDFQIINADDLYNVFISLKDELNLSLHALGHTRQGKFLYIVCAVNSNESSIQAELGFKRCIVIYTVNDGNGKTKFSPVWLNTNGDEYQVSNISGYNEQGIPTYASTCFELSHHFLFDNREATLAIKDALNKHSADFEEKLCELNEIHVGDTEINEFHHSIYRRFEIGNEKTKRNYDIVMDELHTHYLDFNAKLPEQYQSTLCSLYLSLVAYLDLKKKRKLGKEGRITSINFTHDIVTKRTAFELSLKLASQIIHQKSK